MDKPVSMTKLRSRLTEKYLNEILNLGAIHRILYLILMHFRKIKDAVFFISFEDFLAE